MDKYLKTVKALYSPKEENMKTVRPELKMYIGEEFTFQYSWIMGEEDPFPDVWALTPINAPFHYWVPEFDLDIQQPSE